MPELPPPEDRTFRGGFRILPTDDADADVDADASDVGRRIVDAWGADLPETLARCVESVFSLMGKPATLVAAPPLDVIASGAGDAGAIGSAVAVALEHHARSGRWVTRVRVRRIERREVDVDAPDVVAVRLSLEGGAVDRERETELRSVTLDELAVARLWKESQLLRARLHVEVEEAAT